jgi:DNA-binding NarL/FixJ family response regulator
VVGEFPTLAAAEAASVEADGILLAPANVGRVHKDPAYMDAEEHFAQESLTPREIEVLELLAEGLPNRAIAERLGISSQTVKFHVASISGKLGAANRTDAVRRAVRRGLIAL